MSNKAQKECQSAATNYQRASGIHAAAKETIALAEARFTEKKANTPTSAPGSLEFVPPTAIDKSETDSGQQGQDQCPLLFDRYDMRLILFFNKSFSFYEIPIELFIVSSNLVLGRKC